MIADPRRRLDIPGAQNLRDLGGYVTTDNRMMRWRRVLRGDALHRLMPEGLAALEAEGLTTVIDLRSPAELQDEPNPYWQHPDVTFHHKPVYDDLAPALLATRSRRHDDPLIPFYLTALVDRGEAMRDILATIAAAPPGAVLFHCTAGKDRTGLVAALLLGLAGVDRQTILADYSLTGAFIGDLVAELLERTRRNGGDTEAHARLLSCASPTMAATLEHIDRRHGSMPGYLADIGLSRGDVSALRDRLLED
jgi:protein-tyrosine phosphatase